VQLSVTGTSHHGIIYDQPGHVITLMPPLRIENLLPVDINFYIKENDTRGEVKPGQVSRIVTVSALVVTLDPF